MSSVSRYRVIDETRVALASCCCCHGVAGLLPPFQLFNMIVNPFVSFSERIVFQAFTVVLALSSVELATLGSPGGFLL